MRWGELASLAMLLSRNPYMAQKQIASENAKETVGVNGSVTMHLMLSR